MRVDDVETPVGLQESAGHASPLLQIGEPAEDPVGHEDNVEALGQPVVQSVDVRLYESRVDSSFLGQRAGQTNRFGGKVDPGHDRATPGPRQRVESKVTLKVQEGLAGNVSQFLAFHPVEPASAGLEIIDAVDVVSRMNARHLIPVPTIQFQRRIHRWYRSNARWVRRSIPISMVGLLECSRTHRFPNCGPSSKMSLLRCCLVEQLLLSFGSFCENGVPTRGQNPQEPVWLAWFAVDYV